MSFAPPLIIHLPRFEWEAVAGTFGERLQVEDRVPQAGSSILNPQMARFP